MSLPVIQELLREVQIFQLRQRRSVDRKPFVRPVMIVTNRDEYFEAFSRDISQQGIGLITRSNWAPGTLATLRINAFDGSDFDVVAEARWCDGYGSNYYLSGWVFLRQGRA